MTSVPNHSRIASAALAAALLALPGCSSKVSDNITGGGSDSEPEAPAIAGTHAKADDGDYKAKKAIAITLADGASKVKGAGAAVKDDVVTISEPGTYVVSGSLTDGQIKVNSSAEGKVKLVLDNADITSASTSPIFIAAADEAVVIAADGSKNTLSDSAASSADDQQPDAPTGTLFSAADLTLAGTGSLTVNGKSGDGIVGKDGLVILGGTVTVDATDDAIAGKDYLVVHDGTLDVTAGGDGLKSNGDTPGELGYVRVDGGTGTVRATKHGLSAEGAVKVTGGTVDVEKSDDGVKSRVIAISGGTLSVTALSDGLKLTSGATPAGAPKTVEKGVSLTVSDGVVNIDAGGDGIDSRGSATVTGGVLTIGKAGKNAIDVLGTSKLPERVTVPLTSSGKVELKDSSGSVVATFTATKSGPRDVIAQGIATGQTYTMTVDGNDAGKVAAAASKP